MIISLKTITNYPAKWLFTNYSLNLLWNIKSMIILLKNYYQLTSLNDYSCFIHWIYYEYKVNDYSKLLPINQLKWLFMIYSLNLLHSWLKQTKPT